MDAQDIQAQAQEEHEQEHWDTQAMLNTDKWGLDPRLQDFLDRAAKRVLIPCPDGRPDCAVAHYRIVK